MRACVQRVTEAQVTVDEAIIGQIASGVVVLLGVGHDDTPEDARILAKKVVELRIFGDDQGKMNRSLIDIHGALLVVSQFTLFGDCRKGRRPSFVAAAHPSDAERLYQVFIDEVQGHGIETATGRFREMMQVALVNGGPVTLLLDTKRQF